MPYDSTGGLCRNPVSDREWFGADRATLLAAAADRGFTSGDWATAHQWSTLGERVREGERPERVQWLRRGQDSQPGQRTYEVFAREQLASWRPAVPEPRADSEGAALAAMRRGAASLLTFLIRKGASRIRAAICARWTRTGSASAWCGAMAA
jgi:hypothetical protein